MISCYTILFFQKGKEVGVLPVKGLGIESVAELAKIAEKKMGEGTSWRIEEAA